MGNAGVNGTRQLATNAGGAGSLVSQTIKNNCVVIFSKSTCPYCRLAKSVFDDINVKYHTVELNQRPDGSDIASDLIKLTGKTTVPQVFVNGVCIGGGQETKRLQEEGKLQDLVKKCQPCQEISGKL